MSKWYYVQGSDRVGPVDLEDLKVLYDKSELNQESFVWKKGFENWKRIKEVSELYDFLVLGLGHDVVSPDETNQETNQETIDETVKEEKHSPEIVFNFNWSQVKDDEDIFFIKIGKDRKKATNEELFGPFSINEIREAIDDKRINHRTFLFATGMKGWVEIGETPINPVRLTLNESSVHESPYFLAIENEPLPHMALVKSTSPQTMQLIGASHFPMGVEVLCTLYKGLEIKGRDIKIKVEDYSAKEQLAQCAIIEIASVHKDLLVSHAS